MSEVSVSSRVAYQATLKGDRDPANVCTRY